MSPALPASDYYGGSAPSRTDRRSVRPARRVRAGSAGVGRIRTVPVFTVIRSTEEEPDCVPAASPWVRRRPSPWPPRAAGSHHPRSSPPPDRDSGCAPLPAQIRQVRAGEGLRDVRRRFLAYSSPSRSPGLHHLTVLAHPGLVGAAPTLPGTTRIRLPPAPRTRYDRPAAKVSHLHSNHSASRRKAPLLQEWLLVTGVPPVAM
jgi:hypothetical protein